MEKILVIWSFLILTGFTLPAQQYVNDRIEADSIVRPPVVSINAETSVASENELPKSSNLNLPQKGNRDKNNSTRNGLYVSVNANGDTQFISNYRKGKMNGEWMSWYNNRNICDSGLLIDDVPEGIWKGWYANGNPRYILQFSERKLSALKAELMNQPKTKYFILANKTPDEAARHYDAQLLFGHKKTKSNADFLTRKVNHSAYDLSAIKNIVSENADGTNFIAYKAPFAEGLLHGQFTSFYTNGAIKENGLYLNGLREGIWEEFSLQNEKAVGTYRHGYRHGEWRYYNQQGKLLYWKRFDAKGKETEKYSFAFKSD